MHNILNLQQIQSFIKDGFIRIDNVFSADLASEARNILGKISQATQMIAFLGHSQSCGSACMSRNHS